MSMRAATLTGTPGTDEDVDAGRGGNYTKWINNADIDQTNCYAANILIDGKNRIGIFAADRVEKGQELFFHYYWPKEFTQGFGTPPSFEGPLPPAQQLLERQARLQRRNRRRSPLRESGATNESGEE
jgi:SET domain-containing protein